MRSSNISKFFNLKISTYNSFEYKKKNKKKHRVFVLTFMFNKMSSFQMKSLKVMESLMVATFTFGNSRCA